MKEKIMIVFIVLAVLTAGCTQTDQEEEESKVDITPNDGLSIDFSTPTDTYYINPKSEDPGQVSFQVDVQNTGEAEAILRDMELYRAAWIPDSQSNIIQDAFSKEWSTDDVLDMTLEEILDESFNEGSYGDTVKERVLQGVDEENEIPGGQKTHSQNVDVSFNTGAWGSDQNPLRQGESYTYNVGLKTKYQYYTDAKVEFTVLPSQEWRDGNFTVSDAEFQQTAGPVNIDINADSHYPAQTGRIILPITIENVGDGRFGRDEDGDEFIYDNNGYYWNDIPDSRVYIEAGSDNAEVVDCPFGSGNTKVYNGQKQAQCTINLDNIDEPTDLVMRMHIVYDYVEDQTTEVKLVGTED